MSAAWRSDSAESGLLDARHCLFAMLVELIGVAVEDDADVLWPGGERPSIGCGDA
jgi:hypothetical protein